MDQTKPTLQSVTIHGNAVGFTFQADIQQIFVNNSRSNVEFIYTFPMPADASVCAFSAKTASNTFKGVIEEREEALKKYKDAISRGDGAYMLESHRDNIFQVSLGNVGAGETIEVSISYLQDLKISEKEIRLTIPTLVGVRYIPGLPVGKRTGMGDMPPTDRVPDADFITPARAETEYRADIEISLALDNEIMAVTSPSHPIVLDIQQKKATVRMAGPIKMDSDFVLSIALANKSQDIYVTAEADGEYFSYVSFTPRLPLPAVRRAKEFLFLIDVSGSMTGVNIDSAKRALKLCLRNMMDGDRFNIIAFESRFEAFAEKSVPYNSVNFVRADKWVEGLVADGGTEIASAMRFAVENAICSTEWESIMILLTDGQIGNEDEIIEYVKKAYRGRIFTLGIDTNVNDSFLNRIAEVCGGRAEFYYPGGGEDLDKKVVKQFLRTDAAAIKNLTVPDGCGLAVELPGAIYAGDNCRLLFKSNVCFDPLEVTGMADSGLTAFRFSADKTQTAGSLLRRMWAKQVIGRMEKDLIDINPRHLEHAAGKIAEISKTYGVLCRYTNFIAFDERDKKFTQFPVAAVIESEIPRKLTRAAAGAMPMPSLMMMAPLREHSAKLNLSPVIRPDAHRDANERPVDSFCEISGLYRRMYAMEDDALRAFCRVNLREILLSMQTDQIDYEQDFFKLDWIMSKSRDILNDTQGINLYNMLMAGLGAATLEKISTALIASKQNIDGSFGQCEQLQKRVTTLALSRMIKDDPYLYGRQIRKAFAWAKNTDWADADDEKRLVDELLKNLPEI